MPIISNIAEKIKVTEDKLYICNLCEGVWDESKVKIVTILTQTQSERTGNEDYQKVIFDRNSTVICNVCSEKAFTVGVKLTPTNAPQSPSELSS